jgi:hypothetical protein
MSMKLPWYRHDWGNRTLADVNRDNPRPPSTDLHAHFHLHGGVRHSHDHTHASDPGLHAHSALTTLPRHD